MAKLKLIVPIAGLLLLTYCKSPNEPGNLEQADNALSQRIVTPGMSSIGLIKERQIFVYYLNERKIWVLDKNSQFQIPKGADGLVTPGMGTIAVLEDDVLNFYSMDSSLRWETDPELTMPVTGEFNRISAMKMPWQRGIIVIEDMQQVLHFYYLEEDGRWEEDETARFSLPGGIENYLMLGSMDIAIISDGKLGVYTLGFSGDWTFQDDMVLMLPENTDAVLSYEPGTVAVLSDSLIRFFDADFNNRYWVLDDTMNFTIPDSY